MEAVAVRVTALPLLYEAEHVPLVQERPVGELETVPEPVTVTESGWELATAVNVAVADRACDIDTEQVIAVVVHAPTQPENM